METVAAFRSKQVQARPEFPQLRPGPRKDLAETWPRPGRYPHITPCHSDRYSVLLGPCEPVKLMRYRS